MKLYVPEGFALFTAALFLLPNHAWIDNVIVTETPYLFFFSGAFYYMLRMGKEKDTKNIVKFSIFFLLALSFRANIIILPVFAAVYLLLCNTYTKKELMKTFAVFAGISLLFFIPWTIRNYIVFDDFIPVTYGAANPTLKGTYQGEGFPTDDELDYETNVEKVVREEYAKYFDEEGNVKNPDHEQYIESKYDKIKAEYRISEWLKRDKLSFFKSYLITKPLGILTWVYYWGPFSEQIIPPLNIISKINFVLCVAGFITAFIVKEKRER